MNNQLILPWLNLSKGYFIIFIKQEIILNSDIYYHFLKKILKTLYTYKIKIGKA